MAVDRIRPARRSFRRLSGQDAFFLAMETPVSQVHTLKLSVLESAWPEVELTADIVREAISQVLHAVPCYTQRILPSPLGLHHPVLVDDSAFDLDNHVFHRRVPEPGGVRERDAIISDVCGAPLDRRHPLWQIWILTGLQGGRTAVLLKLHHSLADGRVATNQLKAFTSAVPEPLPVVPDPPSVGSGLRYALSDRLTDLAALPALVRDTVQRRRAVKSIRSQAPNDSARLTGGTRTRFSEPPSAQRSWGTVSLPLADVKAVSKRYDVSINDVLLTMTGYALRRYLQERGELPDSSLTAGLPMDTSGPDEATALQGNKWATSFVSLRTDDADVVMQLRDIHKSMAVAKAIRQARGDLAERWMQYISLPLLSAPIRVITKTDLLGRAGLPAVSVSNVRGPSGELHFGGLTVADFFSVGPLVSGAGLNITAWSYANRFNISLLSAHNIVPDPDAILHLMTEGLRELADRTAAVAAAPRDTRTG